VNSTEGKIARAIADTPMPDVARRALAERLADDLSDRASFSRTAWLLACSVSAETAERPAKPASGDADALHWAGALAGLLALALRGRPRGDAVRAEFEQFLASPFVRARPGFKEFLRSI
jgi:hypothetical protein